MLMLVVFVDTVYSSIGSYFFLYKAKMSLVNSEINFTEPPCCRWETIRGHYAVFSSTGNFLTLLQGVCIT